MEQQLNQFFNLLKLAIARIPNEYFSTAYTNIQFQQRPRNDGNQVYEDGVLYRLGERVLCYELYHQLQSLISFHRVNDPEFLQGCLLQGELKKRQILDIIHHYDARPLEGAYVPDLLMHTPSNFDLNAFVVEVKVSPHIQAFEVNYDLIKVIQFITRYHYHRGSFIAINISMEELARIINDGEDTQELRGSLNNEIASRIHLITKNWQEDQIEDRLLVEILNQ